MRSAPVNVTAHATDLAPGGVPPSGVRAVTVEVTRPYRGGPVVERHPLRRSGKPGEWVGSVEVPRGALPGTWQVTSIRVSDGAGNDLTYSAGYSGWWRPFTAPAAWQTRVEVKSPTPDRQPPEVSRLVIEPSVLDTRLRPGRIHIEVVGRDDVALVGAGVTMWRDYARDTARRFPVQLTRVGDDTFSGDLQVPRWVGSGKWVAEASVSDANGSAFHADDGPRLPGVEVISGAPPKPYVVRAHTGSPRPGRDGGARVPVSVVVDGGGAPVRAVRLWASRRASRPYLVDLAQADDDRAAGRWRGKLVLDRCAAGGDYSISGVITDARGKDWYISRGSLTRAGAARRIPIPFLTGDDRDPLAVAEQISRRQHAVIFSEGVRSVEPALTVVNVVTGKPLPVVWTKCRTSAGALTPCSGTDPVVRRVDVQLREPLPRPLSTAFFVNLESPVPQITDGGGNPVTVIE